MHQKPLSNLRDRLESSTRPAREKLQNLLLNMTPRDRILLLGLVVFVCLMLVFLGGMSARKSLKSLKGTVSNRESQLQMVNELRMAYAEASGKKEEIDQQLATQKDITLSAFFEKAADKVQIRDNLKQVRERSVNNVGDLEEKQFSIQITRITLEQLASFLYEVEAAGYPLKIKTLKLKTLSVGGTKTIDATLEVSAFRVVEKAEEGT